ncbi:unnamed protein product [Miscanthus lutarioriparius]|uniref:Retrotransposon gag domain-containing protein n=1 Tax=Miscanthus lutarioriparius TaxID=422564 RepID=A0A811N4N2_9POAL|nr:unnamed protein product [Miscanthus lutarioriparius]
MDPALQFVLDTMNNRFDELDRRFTERDRAAADRAAAIDSRFAALEATQSAAASAAATTAAALEQRLSGLGSARLTPVAAAIEQRLTTLEANYIDRDADYSQRISDLEALQAAPKSEEHDSRVVALEKATADLAAWRPDMEGLVDDVRLQVQKLDSKCDRMVFDTMPHGRGLMQPPAATTATATAGTSHASPSGHRAASTPRDVGSGVVTTWTHVPAKGTCFPSPPAPDPPGFMFPPPPPPPHPNPPPPFPPPPPPHQNPPPAFPPPPPPSHPTPQTPRHPFYLAPLPPRPPGAAVAANPTAPPAIGQLPKLSFPRFDGDNPRHWRSLCVDYFEMYLVPSSMWGRISKQHLDGAAAGWFQSIEPELDFSDWQGFCRLLHDCFDHDQKELLIRQLFHAKQTSTVAKYVKLFTELVDQLKAYSQSTDPMFYTMRFIDGLRADIKAIVLVLRPKDLDTACTVALLQEESASTTARVPRMGDWSSSSKSSSIPRTALPLPLPPTRQDQNTSMAQAAPSVTDAKLAAIKSYRRALGLCFKCGVKWSEDHKCAPEVLHVVGVLWDSFSEEDCSAALDSNSALDEQLCLALSKAASSGSAAARTIRFQGSIGGIPAILLLDSGSSTSFLSTELAEQLSQFQSVPQTSQVQIAGGSILQSNGILKSGNWSVDHCTFHSDFRILQLSTFDAIIGMDWLTSFSPMHIDWQQKWMVIPLSGSVDSVTRPGSRLARQAPVPNLHQWLEERELMQDLVPERVLQHHWTSGSHQVEQVFIKWSHMQVSLATWESADHLRGRFPLAPAWGHAASQDGGSVSPSANHVRDQQEDEGPAEPSSP